LVLLLLCPTFSAASDVGTLRITPKQALCVNGSWVGAKQLQVGETFTTPDGRVAVVTSVVPVVQKEAVPVYSLQTDGCVYRKPHPRSYGPQTLLSHRQKSWTIAPATSSTAARTGVGSSMCQSICAARAI